MKTLRTLNINTENILKNNELLTLCGGVEKPMCQESAFPYPCFCTAGGVTLFCGCQVDAAACAAMQF
jgi:hypothetical protein